MMLIAVALLACAGVVLGSGESGVAKRGLEMANLLGDRARSADQPLLARAAFKADGAQYQRLLQMYREASAADKLPMLKKNSGVVPHNYPLWLRA